MFEYGISGKILTELATLEGVWFIVLEYIAERTLIDVIKSFNKLTEETACFFFNQMLSVLKYINS